MKSEELHRVFLSLGSNLGDKEANIRKAILLIGERVGLVLRQSSLISTEPWGFESDNRFVNAAVLCETMLSPREVLLATQQIERELGRTHKSVGGHYADRLIDIDILLYDDLRVDEPDLQIPHPLMLKRDFVMIPLREIRD
ncbi:2-amino-4-hydroxy-6-hydroxymethyldihydropteridine diphosphokinase [Prevotella sp. P6B4]|uniref:2-amino-4-hydroxy-6- hydroxymethyldihydropteridine diphosphokinase n=1 Tax=Prevotella sp. P6B4 TaxID=1410614 RepID=UPI000490A011|nr:2-amino-4-hydroxy-6-hydroxymethyldihydropteridine diphosphokinase [Prevotella sp. P6B4]